MELKKEDIKSKVLYICLIDKLKKECDYNKEIPRNKLMYILGVCYRVPKELRNQLIAELLEAEVIEVKRTFKNRAYYGLLIV